MFIYLQCQNISLWHKINNNRPTHPFQGGATLLSLVMVSVAKHINKFNNKPMVDQMSLHRTHKILQITFINHMWFEGLTINRTDFHVCSGIHDYCSTFNLHKELDWFYFTVILYIFYVLSSQQNPNCWHAFPWNISGPRQALMIV